MTDIRALMITFSGLPGTGRATVARAVAARLRATLVRVDTIEQAILTASPGCHVGVSGYAVGIALAESNLMLGALLLLIA